MHDPLGLFHGAMPTNLRRCPEGTLTGTAKCLNHLWFMELEYHEILIRIPIRSDDSWNCDIANGDTIYVGNFVDDGGWRIIWKMGMRNYTRVTIKEK